MLVRMMQRSLLCALIMLGAGASSLAMSIDEGIALIRQASGRYAAMMRSQEDGGDSAKMLIDLDVGVRDLVSQMLSEHKDFEEVKRISKDVIFWNEWPVNGSYEGWQTTMRNNNHQIRIDYRRWPAAGAKLYFCSSTYGNRDDNLRVRGSAYVLRSVNGRMILEGMDYRLGEHIREFTQQEPLIFLGFALTRTREAGAPDPVILTTPGRQGSGAFLRIFAWTFDETTHLWKAKDILGEGLGGVSRFVFDESLITVSVNERAIDKKDVDLRQRGYEPVAQDHVLEQGEDAGDTPPPATPQRLSDPKSQRNKSEWHMWMWFVGGGMVGLAAGVILGWSLCKRQRASAES